ncbi:MAG: prepilin peptidase [Merdibacter sp.]|nr:prepilin peptidase [Merdibacter sp.]
MIFALPLIGSLFVYLVFFHYTALKTWKTGLLCLCLGILLYPAAVMHQEYNAEIIYRYLVFLLFAVIALIDLYCMIIPDMLVLITLLLTFPFTAVSPWERAASLAVILAASWIVEKWRKGSFGWGDVKLCSVCALSFGFSFLSYFRYSLVLGGLFACIALWSGHVKKQTRIPFAPWISMTILLLFL